MCMCCKLCCRQTACRHAQAPTCSSGGGRLGGSGGGAAATQGVPPLPGASVIAAAHAWRAGASSPGQGGRRPCVQREALVGEVGACRWAIGARVWHLGRSPAGQTPALRGASSGRGQSWARLQGVCGRHKVPERVRNRAGRAASGGSMAGGPERTGPPERARRLDGSTARARGREGSTGCSPRTTPSSQSAL